METKGLVLTHSAIWTKEPGLLNPVKKNQRTCVDIIRDLLPTMPETFTWRDMLSQWPEDQTIRPHTLAAGLIVLYKLGTLQIVRQGKGSRPTEYHYPRKPWTPPPMTPQQEEWAAFKENRHHLWTPQKPHHEEWQRLPLQSARV